MSRSYCYVVTLKDNASDNYTHGIPDETDAPQVVFTSLEEAKTAMHIVASKFETFIPVAYGAAFPYESLTFEQLLQKDAFVVWLGYYNNGGRVVSPMYWPTSDDSSVVILFWITCQFHHNLPDTIFAFDSACL